MTAEAGQRKLAPTTLYGLAEKNYTEQFTAWISKEASNPTPEGARSHSGRVTFGGTAFAACFIQQLTRRHVTDPVDAFPSRREDKEQDRSRGRSDRVYRPA